MSFFVTICEITGILTCHKTLQEGDLSLLLFCIIFVMDTMSQFIYFVACDHE